MEKRFVVRGTFAAKIEIIGGADENTAVVKELETLDKELRRDYEVTGVYFYEALHKGVVYFNKRYYAGDDAAPITGAEKLIETRPVEGTLDEPNFVLDDRRFLELAKELRKLGADRDAADARVKEATEEARLARQRFLALQKELQEMMRPTTL